AKGTLTIESKVGEGTKVTLYLPRAEETAAQKPRPEPAAAGDLCGGTVLLVEDNPEVARVSRALLEQLGYRVETVGDATAALAALEQEAFSFVLSDIVMAGAMNGLGLAQRIRLDHPGLPVLLATGYGSAAEEAAREFLVLRKPYQVA